MDDAAYLSKAIGLNGTECETMSLNVTLMDDIN